MNPQVADAAPGGPLAPIALFGFKRPTHMRACLESLALNPEFERSPLYIFCDGSRRPDEDALVNQTRELAQQWPHPAKTVVLAPQNQGLARSVRAGVSRLCAEHGQAIVVEDDLIVSPQFLGFLNAGLQRYAGNEQVMQISAHMFPLQPALEPDALFLPITTSWGWATWQRAWPGDARDTAQAQRVLGSVSQRYRFDLGGSYPFARMLSEQIRGRNDSWAIWWYLHVFLHSGLVLFPGESLIRNEGFDGSGTHCGDGGPSADVLGSKALSRLPDELRVDEHHVERIRRHLAGERGVSQRLVDHWRRWTGVLA